jgi:hypothetical protein
MPDPQHLLLFVAAGRTFIVFGLKLALSDNPIR